MNELIKKITIINRLQDFIKNKYKYIISIIILILIIFAGIQFYFINKQNDILKTSIEYNYLKSDPDSLDFEKRLSELLNKNNFYSILTLLDSIKIKLNNENIESAYKDYLKLLNNKTLDSIYISSIAVNASYSLLNKIKSNNKIIISKDKFLSDIISKINNLVKYIDISLESYEGYKLEILYLIAVIKHDNNKVDFKEMNSLYQQIIDNDKVSPSIKERIKKINDTQKYK
tara:strand:- start:3880 stop:4569 length:690 start_codon:yes stop_codon:yes gene_type:complete